MYKECYKKIIDNAIAEDRTKHNGIYYERHHIVPDFLFKNRRRPGPKGHLDGDPESPSNKVLLTFQEHLMAHYYLYEIYKDTKYGYAAGSALQFFFIKATANHERARTLDNVDLDFLKRMDHIRELGIKAISDARKGTMPVVDAITGEKHGSVSVDHPNVISGKWVHHSKGKTSVTEVATGKRHFISVEECNDNSEKYIRNSGRDQSGSSNSNYKELTQDRKERLWKCVVNSVIEDSLNLAALVKSMRAEFTEFKKISIRWIYNNYETIHALVDEVNRNLGTDVKYIRYFRNSVAKKNSAAAMVGKRWCTDGKNNVYTNDPETFIRENPTYTMGRRVIK